MASINDLPQEMLERILGFLCPHAELKMCKLVCKYWYVIAQIVERRKQKNFLLALREGKLKFNVLSLPQKNILAARFSHSTCIYHGALYLFGGCTSKQTSFNDLWKFTFSTNMWTRLIPSGTYPSPKCNSTMVAYDNNLYLFGGWNPEMNNDLHIYNLNKNTWTQHFSSPCPPKIAGHSATVHGHYMVVFGGMIDVGSYQPAKTDHIYCFDLIELCWFQPNISIPKPPRRYGHSQVKLNEYNLLIIGGYKNVSIDLWLLTIPNENSDSALWTWTEINLEGTPIIPSAFWCHRYCKAGDYIVVLTQTKPSASSPLKESNNKNEQCIRNQSASGYKQFDRPKPSIRPNASFNNEKRLNVLDDMKMKYNLTKSNNVLQRSLIVPKLLNIKNVLQSHQAHWIDSDDICFFKGNQPELYNLHSLSFNNYDLILFGGINGMSTSQGSPVSNTTTIISALDT